MSFAIADIYIDRGSRWILVEMVFLLDAIGHYASIPKDNSGVTHGAVPTPAALIPSRLFVNPLLDRDTVLDPRTLTVRRSNSANDLNLAHPYRNSIGGVGGGLTGDKAKRHDTQCTVHVTKIYHLNEGFARTESVITRHAECHRDQSRMNLVTPFNDPGTPEAVPPQPSTRSHNL
jgi:hypothetical protein